MFVLAWWVWSACMSLVPERDKGGVCHPHRRNDRNNSQLAFRPPPILYACPGAGANEFRVLLDAALMNAGYLSGSMHAEKNLLHDLPGEKHCHPVIFFFFTFLLHIWSTVVRHSMSFICLQGQSLIQVRPFTASSMPERSHPFNSLFGRRKGSAKTIDVNNQCRQCIKKRFSAAIVLLRNPLRAAFIAFCMQHPHVTHGHGWRMKRKYFVPQKFDEFALKFVN